jgi:hypothetical protein
MSAKLAARAERAGTLLVCRGELRHDPSNSARQRLFDDRSMSYWPRLIVTDADRRDDLCPPECFEPECPPGVGGEAGNGGRGDGDGDATGVPRAFLAERLRYLYIGARARAESIAQQRQPGLIETLVKQQIHETRYRDDIGACCFSSWCRTTSRMRRASSTASCWWSTATPPTCPGS